MTPPETLAQSARSAGSEVIVNDLSIEMATANGTGSQSANHIFAKTLFRMGIPVGPKNLFPSNIQGLPTWFTVRINRHGYTARKKELDWLVAMNVETWAQDVAGLRPGAVVLYDSTALPAEPLRDRNDLVAYPVPIGELVQKNIPVAKLRKLLANVVYVGAVAELLGMDQKILEQVIKDTFASKPKAIEVNLQAADLGIQYVRKHHEKRDPYRVEAMGGNEGMILSDANAISALGALMGGCTTLFWYPITPASSVAEALIEQFRRFRVDPATGEHRYADVQCEDELASIGAVLGAGWAGARACTSTSGPGVSLMSEFVGLSYFAELPGVIFDVQRMGPSTGLPTRTSQGDILSTVYCSHGDTEHICLIPGTPEECYEFGKLAFDLADRFQTLVFVLTDLDLGMNLWRCREPEYPTEAFDRGKVVTEEDLKKGREYARFRDVDGDGIPYRTLPGNPHLAASYFTRGSGHAEDSSYSESPEVFERNLARLQRKLETARQEVPRGVIDTVPDAGVGIIAYGSTDSAMQEARDQLEAAGLKTSYLRLRATPLAGDEIARFLEQYERIYVVEQNRDGQMEVVIRANVKEGRLTDRLRPVRHFDGIPIDARTISGAVLAQEKSGS